MFKPTSYRLNEDNTSDKERTDQTNSLYSVYCKADLSIRLTVFIVCTVRQTYLSWRDFQ
jgi:hypothetical protein